MDLLRGVLVRVARLDEQPLDRGSAMGSVSDGFGGILFADENFQEAELGFDPLVLLVLLQHRYPVLLLHISKRRHKF